MEPDAIIHSAAEATPSQTLSPADLETLLESSDDAIFSKTLENVVALWSRGAERVYGYTRAEMAGQPVTRLFPPDRQSEAADILERIKAGERVERRETVRLTKDGRRLTVLLTGSPLRDAGGAVTGALTVARDITKRQQAEEKGRAGWDAADLIHNIAGRRFDKALETAAYRVAQEALTNARRHAAAARVRLLLLTGPEERTGLPHLTLEVRDWGRGFTPQHARRGDGGARRIPSPRLSAWSGGRTVMSQNTVRREEVTVALVDDHAIWRGGVRSMLEDTEFRVVGEAASGREALDVVRRVQPQVVLLDIRMAGGAGGDGLDALQVLKAEFPRTAVLMLTTYDNPTYMARAVAGGAAGYTLGS